MKTKTGTVIEMIHQNSVIVLLCLDDDDCQFTVPLYDDDLDYIDESVIGKRFIYAGGAVIPLD